MSGFKIKPQNVRSTVQDMNAIAKQVKSLEDQIWRIQNGLSFEVAQKERIRKRLRTAQSDTASHYKGIYSSSSTLNNVVNAYETTEHRLAGVKPPHYELEKNTALSDIHNGIIVGPGGLRPHGTALQSAILGALVGGVIDTAYDKYESKTEWLSGVSKKIVSLDREDEKTYYSKNKDQLKDSKIDPFKVIDHTWKDTRSVLHADGNVGDKNGTHASYDVDVLKREASLELYGGLYYTDPDTGKKKLRLAAGLALGYSLTAFSAETEAQLGNDLLGAYAKGNVAAGKVEAKGDLAFGLRDADGRFNPTAHGKASLEAIAVEASVQGGMKIAGADVSAKASVNVGVGAHAEFGFKDRKLSIDVGASLGIGGSIKLDIDVGGAIDAVKGGVKSLVGWLWK